MKDINIFFILNTLDLDSVRNFVDSTYVGNNLTVLKLFSKKEWWITY